jgi:hypothetical protein
LDEHPNRAAQRGDLSLEVNNPVGGVVVHDAVIGGKDQPRQPVKRVSALPHCGLSVNNQTARREGFYRAVRWRPAGVLYSVRVPRPFTTLRSRRPVVSGKIRVPPDAHMSRNLRNRSGVIHGTAQSCCCSRAICETSPGRPSQVQ